MDTTNVVETNINIIHKQQHHVVVDATKVADNTKTNSSTKKYIGNSEFIFNIVGLVVCRDMYFGFIVHLWSIQWYQNVGINRS